MQIFIIFLFPMDILNFDDVDNEIEMIIIYSILTRKKIVCSLVSRFNDKSDVSEFLKFVLKISPKSKYSLKNKILEFIPSSLEGGSKSIKTDKMPYLTILSVLLGLYSKEGMELEMKGITNNKMNENSMFKKFISIDMVKIVCLRVSRIFKIPEIDIKVVKRGFEPAGDGKIRFKVKNITTVDRIDLRDEEHFEKVRGLIVTSRISADFSNRMISTIKRQMDPLNTKITTMIHKREDSGESPGYECSIYVESDNSFLFNTVNNQNIPEKMAEECCFRFLKNLDSKEIFDCSISPIIFTLMALSKGTSSLKINKLTLNQKKILLLLNRFFGTTYQIEKENGNVLKIVGCDYVNPFKPYN